MSEDILTYDGIKEHDIKDCDEKTIERAIEKHQLDEMAVFHNELILSYYIKQTVT
ncbi:MAG: hypothetical protein ACXAD7_11175 [Candidatus Kariarchaeaceae archaeon]|jgi:hypothetical protein